MKKMSKRARGNLLNGLIIFCTLGLVLYLSARSGDIGDAWATLRSARPFWIGMALASWCVFMVFEALGLHVFFLQQKVKIRFRSSLQVALIGSFYSSVTPAATGGQPMQVFVLKKKGVSPGISTSGLAVKFFTFQTALLSMGGLLWLIHPEVVQVCIERGRWIVITGFLLNGLSVAAVLLLAINKNIVRWILTLAIRLGKALHIVKDVAGATSRADAALHDFHASVDMITHHPLRLLWLIFISCIQVLGLMSIAYCVYRALGQSTIAYADILTLQFLLYIAASFTPLPGASGAQEGGFYIFFQHVFPAEQLVGALLLWRFFTYYFTLIIGFGAVVTESIGSMMHFKKEKAEEEETQGDRPPASEPAPESSQKKEAASSPESSSPDEAELQNEPARQEGEAEEPLSEQAAK